MKFTGREKEAEELTAARAEATSRTRRGDRSDIKKTDRKVRKGADIEVLSGITMTKVCQLEAEEVVLRDMG